MDSKNDAGFDALLATDQAHASRSTETSLTPAPRPPREPRESWADRAWTRLATTPTRERILRWAGPVLVTLLAAAARLWDLANPHTLVFDETFYVKDAYTLQQLGYEAQWPTDADKEFNAGNVNVFNQGGSFVVHPPLGKWLISLGFLVFGADNSFSWRISTAVIGILSVILLMVIAKGLFKSTLVATVAGLLFAIDGNAIVMSRVALLDNFGAFFALLGFGAILLDRHHSAGRLAMWQLKRDKAGKGQDFGPALWWRPWLFAAGFAFGLTSAVKWNGLYFLAAFAVYSLVVDAVARRRAGIPFWFTGTVFKQGPVSFLLTVPIAAVTYVTSFTGWLVTRGGYDRGYAAIAGNAWQGALAWVPLPLQSFWHMQTEVYNYNVNEHTTHPYSANPLTWLFMIRPTSMYFVGSNTGQNGCTTSYCGSAITEIANPLIWYGGTVAAFYLVYRLIRFRDWKVGLILMGLVGGYLPWMLYLQRTVYQFYTIAFEPYLLLAIAYVVWKLLKPDDDPPSWERNKRGLFVAVYLLAAIALSIYFWPMWTGVQIDWGYMQTHYWLPTWK